MNDAVGDIKARLLIEEVVSEYVQLKRAGRNFKGLSPFTNERSPSFVVSPEKQIWHDFSSGRGGDIFTFIEAVEGVDFKGALEILARKAGVDLQAYQKSTTGTSHKKSNEQLYAAVEAAVRFYQVQLTKHHDALKYLRETRGFSKQTLLDFQFGYSPTSGHALSDYLQKKGFKETDLVRAGLLSSRNNSVYDMFRGRIMIPLSDAQGRPVGFTARQIVSEKNSPKYINTPSTPLYDKSRQVFGLSQAKEAIRKSGYAVVVEGNLDVVASHQAGVSHVVASAGTALTAFHLKSLQRFTADIRLCFDDDRAGQEAAERAIPLAQSSGVELSIVVLPSGKDPDELIRENPKLWQEAIDQRRYMIDWLLERALQQEDKTTAQGKRKITDKVFSIVRQLSDPIEQEHYIGLLSEKLDVPIETMRQKFHKQPFAPQRRLKQVAALNEPAQVKEARILEQHLLAMATVSAPVAKLLKGLPPDVFSDEAAPAALYITAHPGVSPNGDKYVTMLTLLYEEHYQHTEEEELRYQAERLLSRLVVSYAKRKKQQLMKEMTSTEYASQGVLLQAVKNLDDLVTKYSK